MWEFHPAVSRKGALLFELLEVLCKILGPVRLSSMVMGLSAAAQGDAASMT